MPNSCRAALVIFQLPIVYSTPPNAEKTELSVLLPFHFIFFCHVVFLCNVAEPILSHDMKYEIK